ncbi:peptidyl-prolyl cis-trans isomerase sig-7 [Plodia interpunctella]|uniref:peptidyl-prolyl cis-trans isomerase sig-7 n=1 Tax=Plodia interpunctella TaxID=58824 RepID=UPI0023689075|nr:peptidyl-prolyl cis-trans isomerase sig-7 [Plodia interpunctella]
MAVVIETTLGDITVDLYLDQRPVTCLNFLKLCKMKYYNFNLFHSIRSGFIAQTGDPTGEGSGGQSIFGLLEGPTKRFFSGEKMPKIRHTNAGLLSMVCSEDMMVGSQFFFTLAPDLDSLDGVHCVIGEVTEGHEVLRKLNEVICDDGHRPYQDVRITHTVILEDPFNDPAGFRAPSRSPSPSAERLKGGRIAPDEEIDETHGKSAEEVQEMIEEKEAKARATILEIVGDIPDADIAPPENVLFVCKLNPVTTDEDLEIIFSRFGEIVSCEVIRDKKTGDSLQYAFIEFTNKKSCEDAYFKMDNVLIDDRRIHVDFSQSVSKMRYLGKGRGVKYLDENDKNFKNNNINESRNASQKKYKDRDNKNYDTDKHKQQNHENRTSNREKKQPNLRDSNNRRGRSRSRSQSRKKRPTSRDKRHVKDNNENDSKHREYSKQGAINDKEHRHRERNYHSHHTQHTPERIDHSDKAESPKRRQIDISKSERHKPVTEKYSRREIESNSNGEIRDSKDYKKKTPKRVQDDDSDTAIASKKIKRHDCKEQVKKPESKKTTSIQKKPVEKKKKKKKIVKKRRQDSTSSSDTDSSETSSSSDTSTSSEDSRKKRRTKKRRRRHSSTSSSSDSSDSSSSSSSSSCSSSTSSSSDSEPRKRKRTKKQPQKVIKKSKKRS